MFTDVKLEHREVAIVQLGKVKEHPWQSLTIGQNNIIISKSKD